MITQNGDDNSSSNNNDGPLPGQQDQQYQLPVRIVPTGEGGAAGTAIAPQLLLLALAKDTRYIGQCCEMVQQIARQLPFLARWRGTSDDQDDDDNSGRVVALRDESSLLISTVLYAVVLVLLTRNGTTFGMDACRIEYCDCSTTATNSSSVLSPRWRASLMTVTAALCRYCWTSATTWASLVPALGDNNNNNITSNRNAALSPPVLAGQQSNSNESLRGLRRHQFYEEQRRAMIERSTRSTVQNNNSTKSGAADRSGSKRGPFGAVKSTTTTATSALQPATAPRPGMLGQLIIAYSRSLVLLLRPVLSLTTTTTGEGPHQLQAVPPQGSAGPQLSKVILWLVRLHAAYYYYCSSRLDDDHHARDYLTWMHRLFGVSYHLQVRKGRPPTSSSGGGGGGHYRVIAILMLLQTVAEATQTAAIPVARWWYYLLLQGRLRHQVEEQQQESGSRTVAHPTTTMTAATSQSTIRFLDETSTPQPRLAAELTSSIFSPPVVLQRQQRQQTAVSSSSSSVACSICQQPREHPACPIACGHVFCWTCLQQWVLRVQPECPYCRAKCMSQDILPLVNYSPRSAVV